MNNERTDKRRGGHFMEELVCLAQYCVLANHEVFTRYYTK